MTESERRDGERAKRRCDYFSPGVLRLEFHGAKVTSDSELLYRSDSTRNYEGPRRRSGDTAEHAIEPSHTD